MISQQFPAWLDAFFKLPWINIERRLLVLEGEELWAKLLVEAVFSQLNTVNETKPLIYGDSQVILTNTPYQRFHDHLGSENDCIVFADSQFNIDAFAALSGTIKAGGIMICVISPKLQASESPFLQRFLRCVQADSRHLYLKEGHERSTLEQALLLIENRQVKHKVSSQPMLDNLCVTHEQNEAVQAILKVYRGHRKRPLILTADRGRGKSSALAIACAQLLLTKDDSQEALHIGITAPDKQSLSVFYAQLQRSLPSAQVIQNRVIHENGQIEFYAIDDLIQSPRQLSLLLVDEAAAIPVYLLSSLLAHYHRLVFSSTVHGYEGAGRGFTIKFTQELSVKTPQWQKHHVNTPIRWGSNDPLEALVFKVGLLNANLSEVNKAKILDASALQSNVAADFHTQQVDVAELANDEALLAQVFSVLVTAHYQTKPSDLKLLLENPNVRLIIMRTSASSQVVGVALLIKEGKSAGLTAEEIIAIKRGKRRFKSQFLPQAILTQCGDANAFDFDYLRVMRIAIHPELQQQGLGALLMTEIKRYAHEQGHDFVGASFAANANLLHFWLQQDFHMIKLGFNKDKASGEHSAIVLSATNDTAQVALNILERQFYLSFYHLLVDEYQFVETSLIANILASCPAQLHTKLSEHDSESVRDFCQGYRQYSHCVYSLHLWFKQHLLGASKSQQAECLFLVARLMQKHTIADICVKYRLSGKKALNQAIQQYIAKYLD